MLHNGRTGAVNKAILYGGHVVAFLGETGVSVRGLPITYSFPSSIRLDLITTSGVSVLRLSR